MVLTRNEINQRYKNKHREELREKDRKKYWLNRDKYLLKSKLYRENYHAKYIATQRKSHKKKILNEPWSKFYRNAQRRCCYMKSHNYFKRGIKFFLTLNEVKIIWFRDKAYLMKEPSIDRTQGCLNYEFQNCRFIEMEKNRGRKRSV